MRHKSLSKIKKQLHQFYTYFQNDNILIVSENKAVLPFAYLIYDKNHEDKILISIAVDYPLGVNIATLIFLAQEINKLVLIGPFYISAADGKKYCNEEAIDRYNMESIELNDIEPVSKHHH